MEITFKDLTGKEVKRTTIALSENQTVSILNSSDTGSFVQIDLTKKQLNDYIGALLHVQQKLNKR